MPQRILVVDDDRQIVRLVSAYLEHAGFQTLTAYDGATALRLARTERPDLMVLDLMLPDVDGADLTRTIRADPHLASMPIIIASSRDIFGCSKNRQNRIVENSTYPLDDFGFR